MFRRNIAANPGIQPAGQPDSFSSGLDSPTPVELKDEKAQEQEASSSGVENEAVDGLNPFARIWRAYNNVLHERPILVKSATSFFGFLAGDIIAQIIVAQPFNYWRTLRLVLFGMFMDGPVGHVWYNTLDKFVMPDNPKSNRAVVLKMLADQVIWAPFFSCVFFTFIYTLQFRPQAIIPAIQRKLLPMLLANYALWPLAHIINFKFVPVQQRILYINAVQVGWSAYLSNLQKA